MSEIGNDKTIPVTLMQMRALARYETTIDELIDQSGTEDADLEFPEHYCFTLEDLYEALYNIRAKSPTVEEFGREWFYPLCTLKNVFGIDKLTDANNEGDGDGNRLFEGLIDTEEELFSSVWQTLEDVWIENEDDLRMGKLEVLEDCINNIGCFFRNRGKPADEMVFPVKKKLEYISQFSSDEWLDSADEAELRLCRKFTDELCGQNNPTALRLKGYACYGGNRLYGCDWPASRDCMLKLLDLTDDASYANTLGYIYYYGRCNDGVPEYGKAFEMYSFAAANGFFEAIYKLADMYWHGYACKKSENTALALYRRVYDDTYELFLEGKDTSFADAALRMGNVYFYGIGEAENFRSAYTYYLEADYAIKQRAKDSKFFGEVKVALAIRKMLAKTKERLPKDFFDDRFIFENILLFYMFCDDGYRVNTIISALDDGRFVISLRRLPRSGRSAPKPIFLVIPEIDYCELTSQVDLETNELKSSFGEHPIISITYDFAEWNDTEQRLELYYGEEHLGWIAVSGLELYKKKSGSGKKRGKAGSKK